MKLHSLASLLLLVASAALASAAPPIDLELATEGGVQITAPREWLQLLASAGIENVRVRGSRPGDELGIENRGSAAKPSYHVVGLLTAGDELLLPGGKFGRGDSVKLKDYFARLRADGPESLTAPRVRFGLTERELASVFTDLTQPIDFETKGQPPRAVIERLQTKLTLKFAMDADADRVLHDAKPYEDELKGVSAGTGTAMLLRRDGLVMRPEKGRGQPVVYRIVRADSEAMRRDTLGKMTDANLKDWPIGWETEHAPGEVAPSLFEYLNAEVDGFTLAETLDQIGSRLKVPIYLDRAVLAANHIDLATVKVSLPRTRTYYKRVLDRVLAAARLYSHVRVDEAGKAFLWVTR